MVHCNLHLYIKTTHIGLTGGSAFLFVCNRVSRKRKRKSKSERKRTSKSKRKWQKWQEKEKKLVDNLQEVNIIPVTRK